MSFKKFHQTLTLAYTDRLAKMRIVIENAATAQAPRELIEHIDELFLKFEKALELGSDYYNHRDEGIQDAYVSGLIASEAVFLEEFNKLKQYTKFGLKSKTKAYHLHIIDAILALEDLANRIAELERRNIDVRQAKSHANELRRLLEDVQSGFRFRKMRKHHDNMFKIAELLNKTEAALSK